MSSELTNVYDITVLQNQTYELPFTLYDDDGVSPLDITNWSFTGSIKQVYTDVNPVMYFTSSVVSVPSASIKLTLSATQTWDLTGSKYVYDVICKNPNVAPATVLRIIQGKISVKPGVTEPVL